MFNICNREANVLCINQSSAIAVKKLCVQKNTILNKLNAFESHTASIKQARDERLEAESRAAEADRVVKEMCEELNTVKCELDQAKVEFQSQAAEFQIQLHASKCEVEQAELRCLIHPYNPLCV